MHPVFRPLLLKTVRLIEHGHRGLVHDPQFTKGFLHHMHLHIHLWVGTVHHMKDDIAVARLLQGALKRLDQMVGKLAYKAHRIG